MNVVSTFHPSASAGPIPFRNTYVRLPEQFYEHVEPARVPAPRLLRLNEALASHLGIDPAFLRSEEGIAVLSGNRVAPGSEPIALAYAGHQFGHFVPQLGDGRAVLLGEVTGVDGKRYDMQLKGSGRTRFSRRGDGKAALGPVLREYIVSEAMAALGIPTTRTLAALLTGETVMRERPLPGGVLTRVASSHLRVGTFQYFAVRKDLEALRILTDYAIDRHYPHLREADDPTVAFFDAVVTALAKLVARWMLIGFVHGVLNTDNTSIAGETIDYGPCAFIDAYHPDKVFSSIDHHGRYAFSSQPGIIKWNLARLAECLLPLIAGGGERAVEVANASLARFDTQFEEAYATGMRRKLGFVTARADDAALAEDFLHRMALNRADFTLTFRRLSDAVLGESADPAVRHLFADPTAYDEWSARWRARLAEEQTDALARGAMMQSVNPHFIPRNHRVETAIAEAEKGRYGSFHELNQVLARPYASQPGFVHYSEPPQPHEEVYQTFCGT